MPSPLDVDEFGSIVRKMRKHLGLTQNSLAVRIGIAQSYVSAIECGHVVDINAGMLGRLSDVLGVPLVELTEAAVARAERHRLSSRDRNGTTQQDISVGGAP